MTVVAARRYRDGKSVGDLALGVEPDVWPPAKNEFVWIGLFEPADEELETVAQCFGLHPLAVEDALARRQLPKQEQYGDQLFLVLRTAHLDNGKISYGQTSFFLGEGFIVTVRQGSARAHDELRAHLEAAPSLLKHGVDYVLHAVLDFIVDGYAPIVDAIEDEVLEMERRALDEFLTRAEISRLFSIRRDLMVFRRILGPVEEVCGRLQHLESVCLDPEVRPYFKDVHDHVRRVGSRAEALRDVIGSVFEAATLLEQQRQSAITRKLAAWAAILAVPTAVAGIYGMNFDHMPELRWTFGYPLVVAMIAVACAYLYARFKSRGWL